MVCVSEEMETQIWLCLCVSVLNKIGMCVQQLGSVHKQENMRGAQCKQEDVGIKQWTFFKHFRDTERRPFGKLADLV